MLQTYVKMLMDKNKTFFHSTFLIRTSFLAPIPVTKDMDSKAIIHYLLDFMIFVQKKKNWTLFLGPSSNAWTIQMKSFILNRRRRNLQNLVRRSNSLVANFMDLMQNIQPKNVTGSIETRKGIQEEGEGRKVQMDRKEQKLLKWLKRC
jgi:hypothetical protein